MGDGGGSLRGGQEQVRRSGEIPKSYLYINVSRLSNVIVIFVGVSF